MSKAKKNPRREHVFGDLYEALSETFPDLQTERKTLNVQKFARVLGYSNETVYKALREFQPLSLGIALRIIEVSRENQRAKSLYWPDLLPFVLPGYPEYMAPVEKAASASVEVDDLLG
ncbi:hypothetical protein ACM25O_13365 [Sulfitobacter pontiacus]